MRKLIGFCLFLAMLAYGSAAIVRNVAAKCVTHDASIAQAMQ